MLNAALFAYCNADVRLTFRAREAARRHLDLMRRIRALTRRYEDDGILPLGLL